MKSVTSAASAATPAATPFADRALEALSQWPALRVCRADCGAGIALATSHDVQVVHLLRPDEAELYLTWPATLRLSVALAGYGQVRFGAGDDWVRVRLQTNCEVSVLMSLVSVAIQANTRAAQQDPRRHTPCPQCEWRDGATRHPGLWPSPANLAPIEGNGEGNEALTRKLSSRSAGPRSGHHQFTTARGDRLPYF